MSESVERNHGEGSKMVDKPIAIHLKTELLLSHDRQLKPPNRIPTIEISPYYDCMAKDTIYLCNFRVSVDGEWLCLKELADVQFEPNQANPIPPAPEIERDPATIERSNLVNVTKLVVKELIESSLKYGRQLDSDHVPLQHFFILLEHVMRHGLKPKKGLLGPKKELWNVLEIVERFLPEAADITASVRDLPVKTHLGRARAWLRLALMQKRLADYFRLFVERKDILGEYYERDSLMLSEEAVVVGGLLVGLNVIDCNLCVKGEDLDCQQGVIDFSLYLRDNSHTEPAPGVESASMTAVLDQKNYIEELNRHLNATVTNLQQKVEQFQTNNALMKEDLAIAKNTILALQEENERLRLVHSEAHYAHEDTRSTKSDKSLEKESFQNNPVVNDSLPTDSKKLFQEELQKRKELERELQAQVNARAEAEMALKLLEKDIHEKQDTIISLRRQMEDIKAINLQLYNKLQECEGNLKHKTDHLGSLDQKTVQMADSIRQLEAKLKISDDERLQAEDQTLTLSVQLAERDRRRAALESDLKIEKEWRSSLQAVVDDQKDKLANLRAQIEEMKSMTEKYEKLQNDYRGLQKKCDDHEMTLEEVGSQLKESQLMVEDLRESHRNLKEAVWTDDKEVKNCNQCEKPFSITQRKHHCRYCGEIYCSACSDNTMPLPSSARPVRVCDGCHTLLLQRYSAT